MSHLQWLGIWGMTLYSEPERKDLDKWSKGVTYVLQDAKGRHYFGEYLKESGCGSEVYVKILELWVMLDELLCQGEPVEQNKVEEILGEAERYLTMTPHDVSELRNAIVSKNEDKIKDVQGEARDKLEEVYKKGFIEYATKKLK